MTEKLECLMKAVEKEEVPQHERQIMEAAIAVLSEMIVNTTRDIKRRLKAK